MNKQIMLGQLHAMQEFFDRSTGSLDDGDSGVCPAEGMFTAAGQIAHVAQTVDWFMTGAFAEGGFTMDWEGMEKQVRAVTTISHAREWFANAMARAKAAVEAHSEAEWAAALPAGPIMGGMPRASILGAMTDHTAHHRGALTVYARLQGKTPPMPYM
ncbi:MAG: DinB family protein [Candidatus Solibacter usitatus]|nr:DinB family protein [Candidatus Solibacter usitatus]